MKKVRVAINGFGRIGRLVLRAILLSKRHDIEVVAINDVADVETNAHLFKWDSVHGMYPGAVSHDARTITIDGHKMDVFAEADPSKLPWKKESIDVVMECSGRYTDRAGSEKHLQAGARKVLISAPAKGEDRTVVYGVNHKDLKASDLIVSNASCTTNCLVPVAYVLDRAIGVEKGYMTTIHSYTGDQRLIDTNHPDLRRARAGALSIIPTSTGAAKAVALVLPHLKGKIDGTAIRVPTPNVSVVDFVFVASKNTTVEAINEAMSAAAHGPLKHILEVTDEPLVSIDFNNNPHSSIFDLSETSVVDGNLGRVLAWYDNEWGFSNRMSDTAVYMSGL